MPAWLADRFERTRGLGFRLALMLSIAILPIGLISLVQTLNLSREATRAAEQALLGRTAIAAAGERALLQSAVGTADALAPAVLETLAAGSMRNCMDLMTNFVQRSAIYRYAGFTGLDGMSNCNSSGDPRDMSDTTGFARFADRPGTHIFAVSLDRESDLSAVVVMQPVYTDASLVGYVTVSISHDLLRSTHASDLGKADDKLMTFSGEGEMLSFYASDREDASRLLPANISLAEIARRPETTFRARSGDGQERVFSVVPIVPSLAYAMGSYATKDSGIGGFRFVSISAVLFTLALFTVSLAVAYFGVDFLVLRHVRELRGQMRRFAIGDRSQLPRIITEAPSEIADVSQTFHNMARILVRDESRMEKAVLEKTVLLKEVHHRVKNNLQLIASIINMQNRLVSDPDAQLVLRSVQDRVASMATIYRSLYQAEHLDAVEVSRLIENIINQMSVASDGGSSRLRVETDMTPLSLLPDQAVPVSLLATEAFTNAIKYSGIPEGADAAWIRAILHRDDDDMALLEFSNSLGPGTMSPRTDSTGLGSQLIDAFASQLEGHAEIIRDADSYTLRVRFRIDAATTSAPDTQTVLLTSAPRAGAQH